MVIGDDEMGIGSSNHLFQAPTRGRESMQVVADRQQFDCPPSAGDLQGNLSRVAQKQLIGTNFRRWCSAKE
ncbi:hypothetical protein [Bradyrhizobium icense]|uniref:hypothetical protein n=1 Tax=Bradyrhizobium icense TaxID=1274631 RepID=UPI0018D2DEBF|nr:hypothetical protein [Bradyrhizobium icense]